MAGNEVKCSKSNTFTATEFYEQNANNYLVTLEIKNGILIHREDKGNGLCCTWKDFEVSISKVKYIAVKTKMIFDDEEYFIVVVDFENNVNYIYWRNLNEEWHKLKRDLNFSFDAEYYSHSHRADLGDILYPKHLEGNELYEKWTFSIRALFYRMLKLIGVRHPASGLIKKKFEIV